MKTGGGAPALGLPGLGLSHFLAKYWFIFLLGLQNAFIYRWNLLIRASFSLLSLAVAVILWMAAFSGQAEIGGYGMEQTISYFIVLMFFNYAISAFNEDYQIATDIRMGTINQFLLKPMNYLGYRLTTFFASRLVSVLAVVAPIGISLLFLSSYFYLPDEPWRWALVVVTGAMAAVLQFLFAYCFGLLAFWFLEIRGLVLFSFAVETFLSGQYFPLDLLPANLYRISQFLPFYYQMYFPVAIFSGRLSLQEVLPGIVFQAAWLVALFVISQILWRFGLRQHTAVGG